MNQALAPTLSAQPQAFTPPRVLRHAHLQSTLSSTGPRRRLVARQAEALCAASQPLTLECGDGVRLQAHASLHGRANQGQASGRPLIIAIHGWNGSHESSYLLSAAATQFRAGCDVVRLNLRDHGGTAHLNRDMFHSCRLDEALAAVTAIIEQHGPRPYGLLGFSLGGNFALRIANAAGDLPIVQTLAVCPLLDPGHTMAELDAGWFGYRLYFMRKWRKALAEKDAAFPGVYDFSPARGLRSITAMTAQFVEAYTPYPTLASYLDGYTIHGQALGQLAAPATILAALDDPVCPADALTRLPLAEHLQLHTTRWGGHCGFLANLRLDSWADSWIYHQFRPLLNA